MNGRIYDPTLGRFLQADPFIQSPTNTQSINLYTYIFNNPLSGTDPTGYSSELKSEITTAYGVQENQKAQETTVKNGQENTEASTKVKVVKKHKSLDNRSANKTNRSSHSVGGSKSGPTGMKGEDTFQKEIRKPEYKKIKVNFDIVVSIENPDGTTSSASSDGSTSDTGTINVAGPIVFGASKDKVTKVVTKSIAIAPKIGVKGLNVSPSVSLDSAGNITGTAQ